VLKGNLKDLNEIPPCGLLDSFARNLETLDPTFHQTFVEGCTQRIPERPPNQEQYQKHFQEQKKPKTALRAGAMNEGVSRSNGLSIVASSPLVAVAHETLKITNPNGPIDELIDTCQWLLSQKNGGQSYPRAEVIAALNAAIAENRAAVQ
jgi:hypothetical protein